MKRPWGWGVSSPCLPGQSRPQASLQALHRAEWDRQGPSANALSPCKAPSCRCQGTHDKDISVQTRMLPHYFKKHHTTQTLSFEVSVHQMTLLRYYQLILSSWPSAVHMMEHLPPSPTSWGNCQAFVFQGLPRWKGCDQCLSATEAAPKTPSLDWAQRVKVSGRWVWGSHPRPPQCERRRVASWTGRGGWVALQGQEEDASFVVGGGDGWWCSSNCGGLDSIYKEWPGWRGVCGVLRAAEGCALA